MNAQLVEAIRQLNLKPGESYTVEVDGRKLVIRDSDTPEVYEGQVMMLPWFESPDPSRPINLIRGGLPLPDPVIVPTDDEDTP